MRGVASPTERADKVTSALKLQQWFDPDRGGRYPVHEDLLDELKDAQLVTPENIAEGWRVLTPEQAETVLRAGARLAEAMETIANMPDVEIGEALYVFELEDWASAVPLLAGVPGKDSDT